MVVKCAKYRYWLGGTFIKNVEIAKTCDNCDKPFSWGARGNWIFDTKDYLIYVFCSEKCLEEWVEKNKIRLM